MDLNCKSLKFSFGEKVILKDFDLSLKSGSHVWIRGPSGSGKSTLLAILAGLHESLLVSENKKTFSGNIHWSDYQLQFQNADQNSTFRKNHICFVHQENHLIPHWNLQQNFELFGLPDGRLPEQELMKSFGLQHLKMDQLVKNLSGGERQRLNLLRVILEKKPVVLLDEPTSHLDDKLAVSIMKQIKSACANSTLLVVSHDNRLETLGFQTLLFQGVQS